MNPTTDVVQRDDLPPAAEPNAEDQAGEARANDQARSTGSAWTIPMLCTGIALIAACVLIPLADENRQLVYERTKLELDLAQIKKQVAVNEEFLRKLGEDPTLAERLAQRQMKTIREDAQVVDLGGAEGKAEMSPFMLVSLPPPPPLEPYSPVGGVLARLCLQGKVRLFLVGTALMLCAGGLVSGGGKKDDKVTG